MKECAIKEAEFLVKHIEIFEQFKNIIETARDRFIENLEEYEQLVDNHLKKIATSNEYDRLVELEMVLPNE